MGWANISVLTENIGDYCLGREQDGIESFESCMRNAEERTDNNYALLTFIAIAVIVAIFFYNRSKTRAAEAAAAQAEQKRRDRLSPKQRIAEDVDAARARAIEHERARSSAEELEAHRRMWASGIFKPGIPLPPEYRGPRPKPEGHAPPGWYDAPPGDGNGLYYRRNYLYQYWDGKDWVQETEPASQHYYWTRRR
jgi:Ni/Co efflux regulator RcnB